MHFFSASKTEMRTSRQGLDLLMGRESVETHAYLDSRDIPTIGVGHTGPEVHMGLIWTMDQVRDQFARDIARFEKAINDNVHVTLLQNQFDALVSWLFNVGTSWAEKPAHLIKLVNAGSFDAAAVEFDQWHIPPEVTSRRNGEREQFKGAAFEARIAA